jgi:probable F420-dependent oxidoreductase
VKVRIGYGLGTQGFATDARFLEVVDGLERLGFDSLWLAERATGSVPDPIVALAVAAGRTRRLKLGTSVLVVPGRNPVLLAKALASLDRLSAGRLLLATGLGIAEPLEQQAFGVAREQRAAWFDEALPLIRRLWTEDRVDHEGPRFRLRGMRLEVKPVQGPLEVWLGGRAPSELRRTGRLGEGWLASFCTPDEAAQGKTVVEHAALQAERQIDPEHFGVIIRYARETIPVSLASRRRGVDLTAIIPLGLEALCRRIEEFIQVGFSKFVLVPAEEPNDWTSELEDLARAVLANFQTVDARTG